MAHIQKTPPKKFGSVNFFCTFAAGYLELFKFKNRRHYYGKEIQMLGLRIRT